MVTFRLVAGLQRQRLYERDSHRSYLQQLLGHYARHQQRFSAQLCLCYCLQDTHGVHHHVLCVRFKCKRLVVCQHYFMVMSLFQAPLPTVISLWILMWNHDCFSLLVHRCSFTQRDADTRIFAYNAGGTGEESHAPHGTELMWETNQRASFLCS
jgi:hypothetical protein